jgi:hypothetical protein
VPEIGSALTLHALDFVTVDSLLGRSVLVVALALVVVRWSVVGLRFEGWDLTTSAVPTCSVALAERPITMEIPCSCKHLA